MLGAILIIGWAWSVGHDMMYQIASMRPDISVVGHERELLKVSESEERARELYQKPRKLYEKYNVK